MMSARRFLGSGGRATAQDFLRQNSRNPARRPRTNVLGLTIASACAHGNNGKTTSASFVAGVDAAPFVPGKGRVAAEETEVLPHRV